MEKIKIKNDGAAGMSYHKMQRAAANAAGTSRGSIGHLTVRELDRRMAIYREIMDAYEKQEVKRS